MFISLQLLNTIFEDIYAAKNCAEVLNVMDMLEGIKYVSDVRGIAHCVYNTMGDCTELPVALLANSVQPK